MTTADELAGRAESFRDYLPAQSGMPAISLEYSQIQVPLMRGDLIRLTPASPSRSICRRPAP